MTPRTLRAAGPDDVAAVLPLAVAFYVEDAFTTAEDALRRNLATPLSSRGSSVRLPRNLLEP